MRNALDYKVGTALGAEGLRRLGRTPNADDIRFYHAHLERLFGRVPSPFVPCYVLLIP